MCGYYDKDDARNQIKVTNLAQPATVIDESVLPAVSNVVGS